MSEVDAPLNLPAPGGPGRGLPQVGAAGLPVLRGRNALRPPVAPDQGNGMRLLLDSFRRWWMWALPAGVVLGGLGVAAVYLLFEPKYEAVALLRIEERPTVLSLDARYEDRSKAFFQTQIELIRQIAVADVMKQPEVARLPDFQKRPDPSEWLAKQIKVNAVGESELFRILYSGSTPDNAALVVNAITKAYFKLREQSESERNQRVIEWLAREKDNRSKDVERLRANVVKLVQAMPAGTSPLSRKGAAAPTVNHLGELRSRLIAAQAERAVLEARIKAAEDDLKLPGQNDVRAEPNAEKPALSKGELAVRDAMLERTIEDAPELQMQKALVAEKQAVLADTEAKCRLGKRDPAYRRLADELRRDEAALDALRQQVQPRVTRQIEMALAAKRTEGELAQLAKRAEELGKMRSDAEGRRILEQTLRDQYDREMKENRQDAGDLELEYEFRRDELDRAEKVFELIAHRTLQLQTEQGAPARVSLLRAAEPPQAPLEAFPYRGGFLAGAAGLCLPFLLVVVWERMIRRVGDARQLEQQSNLAVLGEIARLPSRKRGAAAADGHSAGESMHAFEESIDSLRASLTLSEELRNVRVLAVTSAVSDEGKTSLAAQLAMSMAHASGEPILLIDGDMRCPDVHRVFDVEAEPGLVEVLGNECRLEDAVVTTWSDNVHVLPAGKLRSSPHRLLGNGRWESLLREIPQRYRCVIVDTPPILLAAGDALVLSKYADAAVVCVMRDVSRMDQVRNACNRLASAGCRTVGAVLNGVPIAHGAARYGGYAYTREQQP